MPIQHPLRYIAKRLLPLLLLFAITACGSPPPTPQPTTTPAPLAGSCSLQLPEGASDEDAIRAILMAEGEFVVAQSIDPLMRLWADNGRVIDAKNTKEVTDDDQIWDGRDAIRHRYVRTVFPGAPALIDHSDETITLDGDHALVQATATIGDEVAPSGDLWEMERRDGCWYLLSLTYNLEDAP